MSQTQSKIRVAVVFHSGYGHTARQAQAVTAGAGAVADVESQLIPVEEVDASWQDLERADAIVFGAPTYMGGPSAQFKVFQEATSTKVMPLASSGGTRSRHQTEKGRGALRPLFIWYLAGLQPISRL